MGKEKGHARRREMLTEGDCAQTKTTHHAPESAPGGIYLASMVTWLTHSSSRAKTIANATEVQDSDKCYSRPLGGG